MPNTPLTTCPLVPKLGIINASNIDCSEINWSHPVSWCMCIHHFFGPSGIYFYFWFLFLLKFYVLAISNVISGWAPTCDQCTLMVALYHCPTGRRGHWYHDSISHSVRLSWHSTNQSLPYPINAGCETRKRQVSNLYVIGLTRPGFTTATSAWCLYKYQMHTSVWPRGCLLVCPVSAAQSKASSRLWSGSLCPTILHWSRQLEPCIYAVVQRLQKEPMSIYLP